MADVTVNQFSIKGNVLSGPAEYMKERGNALADMILAGSDRIFNMTSHLSPNVETAILVRLQTDYAAWLGDKELHARFDNKGPTT